jgi:hypothetical protein
MVFSTAALLCIAAVRSNPETNPSAMLICYAQENRNRWFVSILLWPVHSDQSGVSTGCFAVNLYPGGFRRQCRSPQLVSRWPHRVRSDNFRRSISKPLLGRVNGEGKEARQQLQEEAHRAVRAQGQAIAEQSDRSFPAFIPFSC